MSLADLEKRAAAARKRADAADEAARTAKDDAREAAEAAVALEQELDWTRWKALHEEQGYTVTGSGFGDARVAEFDEGPTHDVKVG